MNVIWSQSEWSQGGALPLDKYHSCEASRLVYSCICILNNSTTNSKTTAETYSVCCTLHFITILHCLLFGFAKILTISHVKYLGNWLVICQPEFCDLVCDRLRGGKVLRFLHFQQQSHRLSAMQEMSPHKVLFLLIAKKVHSAREQPDTHSFFHLNFILKPLTSSASEQLQSSQHGTLRRRDRLRKKTLNCTH